ncbi:MAG: hypothetical protein UX18_C0023G0004 [Candidatus Azambacteria bacterium GW2011_GWC2_45_7b]|uniref:Uncharacterized protein n=3 Tax=Parcubacteria group TaxID=1794811 RepID=A0A837IJI9_9BACT|nr:MAG: hypothetical protein UW53_C0003G0107 [Candidatus Giovannonibacteria bacterium GW2011_GWA1_44_25]KKU12459.1 MAG: hypothetical protein UX18_C0023G0004 [Candidatus Azambacteria bacterium GW2011_GWC2_45_7b]KKU30043.1 MAG: hypothetical protein UX43_C0003G0136 [Candidatus Giovannonibacteria bacterium GW2011_GWB1_46_20]
MERTDTKTKLSQNGREMKRVAEAESGIVRIPAVAQPAPEQHDLVAVLAEIRDIQVAVAVLHEMYGISSVPLPFECSWSCIVFGIAMP